MGVTAYDQSAVTHTEAVACCEVVFDMFGIPATMLDVGCGPGHVVRYATSRGVRALGVDLALPSEDVGLRIVDLTQPQFGLPRVELTLCWEVAEHLPEDAADTLVGTLARTTMRDGVLIFTAAIPGQGGTGHVNEQPHDYWRTKLFNAGFIEDVAATTRLRHRWERVAGCAWWYPQNVMVFRKAA